jgi:methionyl aminopeptidase
MKEPIRVDRKPIMELKSPAELEKMFNAGQIVGKILSLLERKTEPGISTKELDAIAASEIKGYGAQPAFLNYHGYPAVICASLNEEVVHGIPSSKRILKEGDILSIDLGVKLEGFFGDSAITVAVGKISKQAQKLRDVTRESLERAIQTMRPGVYLGDVSHAVQHYVESHGMSVVRDFVGHGIGRNLHEEPPVPNYGDRQTGLLLEPGLVLAVEPMVNLGGYATMVKEDGWSVVTADGSLSAHFEHTIAVTEEGNRVLTRIER